MLESQLMKKEKDSGKIDKENEYSVFLQGIIILKERNDFIIYGDYPMSMSQREFSIMMPEKRTNHFVN